VSQKGEDLGYSFAYKTILKGKEPEEQPSYVEKRPVPVKVFSEKNPVGSIEMPYSHLSN
jgi:hypothetical protein